MGGNNYTFYIRISYKNSLWKEDHPSHTSNAILLLNIVMSLLKELPASMKTLFLQALINKLAKSLPNGNPNALPSIGLHPPEANEHFTCTKSLR